MPNRPGKGPKKTPGKVSALTDAGPGRTANSDLTDYTPPMVLEDLDKIKSRIKKATYTGRELNVLARVFTVEALVVFVECVQDKSQSMADRMKAAEVLLNRGWGRPDVVVKGDKDNPLVVEIAKAAEKLNEKLASIIDGVAMEVVEDADVLHQ